MIDKKAQKENQALLCIETAEGWQWVTFVEFLDEGIQGVRDLRQKGQVKIRVKAEQVLTDFPPLRFITSPVEGILRLVDGEVSCVIEVTEETPREVRATVRVLDRPPDSSKCVFPSP